MRFSYRIGLALTLVSVGCSTLIGLEDWTPMPEGSAAGGGTVQTSDGGGAGGTVQTSDGGGTGGVRADGAVDAPVESGPPPKLTCAAEQVTTSGKSIATASTAGGTDSFTLSCGQGSAPDVAFDWIVPATDFYSVNTIGSSFDTVLGLLVPDCNAKADAGADAGAAGEIACNNNTPTTSQSEIVRKFQKGDRVLAVVDGYVGAAGDVVFNAEPITCPSVDLSDQTLPATFTNTDGTVADGAITGGAACGGTGQPEKAFRWTPKTAGLYRLTAHSTAFAPVLYVEKGARCGDLLLQCNKGEKNGYDAEVTRWIEAGQPMTLIVDSLGGTGDFALNVAAVTPATCPQNSGPPAPATDITFPVSAGHDLSPSCAQAGTILNWNVNGPYTTMSYPMTLSIPLSGSCTVKVTSANDQFAAFLVKGKKCDGAEAKCALPTASGPDYMVAFALGYTDTGDYVLVVENLMPYAAFTFQVRVECIA